LIGIVGKARPVIQADAGSSRAAGAFSMDIRQVLRGDGTCILRAASRQHLLFTIDIDFDGAT
jgi:hypothetical protein